MNAPLDPFARYREAFELAGARWGEVPAWFEERRERAWLRFSQRGFPTTRDEAWKYTRLSPLWATPFGPPPDWLPTLRQIEAFLPYGCRCHVAVFVNGRFHPALSRTGHLPEGVALTSLRGALVRHSPELDSLERRLGGEGDALADLNLALVEDGVHLRVDDGVELDVPAFLLHLDGGNGGATMSHLRHVVTAGAGSRFTVFSHHVSVGPEDVHFNHVRTEMALGSGARVDYLKLQGNSPQAYPFAQLAVEVEAGARFSSRAFSCGGRMARDDVRVALLGEDAGCRIDGLSLANGHRHVETHATVEHAARATSSRQDHKGVLTGQARGVFDGGVLVRRGAHKSDARVSSRNLLLSPDVEADVRPQLEINADDVTCSHEATVGQLDEEMAFYLRSRGLDDAGARAVLTQAFVADMVRAVPFLSLRELVAGTVERRLAAGDAMAGLLREE